MNESATDLDLNQQPRVVCKAVSPCHLLKKKKSMSVEKSNERISSIKAVLARMLHFWKNNTEKAAAFGDGDNIWIYLYIWVVHIT